MPIPFLPPFMLIHKDGWTEQFDDLTALAASLGAAKIVVSDHHVAWLTWHHGKLVPEFNEWIVRDDAGRTVQHSDVFPCGQSNYRYICWGARPEVLHAQRLGLPIPNVGRSRRGYANILRWPKGNGARAEHAKWAGERADDRPKGRVKLPPTCWDDIPRSDTKHRSWKTQRNTRWR